MVTVALPYWTWRLPAKFKEYNADPAFREGLLKEGVECLLAGDADGQDRTLYQRQIGFEELALWSNKPPKSLMRMFGPAGIPTAISSRS